MARIHEAQISEDGEIRIVRRGGLGAWRVLFATALLVGGVWLFDAAYGGRTGAAAVETSDTVSN